MNASLKNILMLTLNGYRFVKDIYQLIFLNKICLILVQILFQFIPSGSINNTTALVELITWGREGDKLLSETTNDGQVYWLIYACRMIYICYKPNAKSYSVCR